MLILAVVLAGCGRFGFDADPQATPLIDAPAADDASPLTCRTQLFADTFDTGMPGPDFSASAQAGLTLNETAGNLDISFATVVAASSYAGYTTSSMFAVDGACATTQVVQVPTEPGIIYMKLVTSTGHQIETIVIGDMLYFRTHADFSKTNIVDVAIVPFDLATMAYWRLRVDTAGVSYWETSADAVTYTQRATLGAYFSEPMVAMYLGAGTDIAIDATAVAPGEFASAAMYAP